MKKTKRILAMALLLMLLVSLVPAASADSPKAYWHEKRACTSDPYYQDWWRVFPTTPM